MKARDRKILEALGREGQIASELANPPVFSLVRAGFARFKYRSEDFNIIEITPAGRAALEKEARDA